MKVNVVNAKYSQEMLVIRFYIPQGQELWLFAYHYNFGTQQNALRQVIYGLNTKASGISYNGQHS